MKKIKFITGGLFAKLSNHAHGNVQISQRVRAAQPELPLYL